MAHIEYSQNFLISNALVCKLIEKAQIRSEDYVIEVGPGKGKITDILAQYAGRVTAIEYDIKLYEQLLKEHNWNNVEYIHADFLKYNLPSNDVYKIFSNIPFQITADIIRKLTETINSPKEIFLIMQKEAAKKYCGMPFQKYEGLRAAILKPQYEIKQIHSFEKTDFKPIPNVEIVMLHFRKKNMDMTFKEYQNYKNFVSFFYSNTKGYTAKERLSLVFSNKQINRLAKDNHFNVEQSYTMINGLQWEEIFKYSLLGLTLERKKLIEGSYERLLKQQSKLKKQNRTTLR